MPPLCAQIYVAIFIFIPKPSEVKRLDYKIMNGMIKLITNPSNLALSLHRLQVP